jgi:hypothetical protein
MDAIGAGGEALLDYAVFDALRAGFGRVVFVIRRDFSQEFKNTVLTRIGNKAPVSVVFQEVDDVPPAWRNTAQHREKPWGTVHALLTARHNIDAPFAVINADDFYGQQAYITLADFLQNNTTNGAIVPYALGSVLSPEGAVTRGFCEVNGNTLASVTELMEIVRDDAGIIHSASVPQALPNDAPVSMNFWGFPASSLTLFGQYFEDFLAKHSNNPNVECFLPGAVDQFIKTGAMTVHVLHASSQWFGVTYQQDRIVARSNIAALVANGVYPERLWK